MKKESDFEEIHLIEEENAPEEGNNSKNPSIWKFYVNIATILSVLFVGEAARGLVVPSLFLYIEQTGGDKAFLGIVVSVFSVGRLFGSTAFGYWYNWRGPREVMMASLVISFVGNVLYGTGYVTHKWVILLSRFLVGFGSGILSPVRAALADIATKQQLVRYMALANAIQFIGFAIMPGLAIVLTYINFSIGSMLINQCSSAGFILAILDVMVLFGIYYFGASKNEHTHYKEKKEEKDIPEEMPKKWVNIGVILFISLNFVTRGILALLETVGAPIYVKIWDTDNDAVDDSSQMFLTLGVFGLVVYVLLDYQRDRIPSHFLLAGSFAVTGFASLFFIVWPGQSGLSIGTFLAGAVLIWSIASPIAQTLILSTFAKILGSQPKGSAMGWIGSAGSVGRIVFPLVAVLFPPNVAFVMAALTSLIGAAAVIVYQHYVKKQLQIVEYSAELQVVK